VIRSAKGIWTFGCVTATAACALLAGMAGAQDSAAAPAAPAAQGASAANVFNIPDNVTMLGTMDPNNRRATAKVNGQIITGTDVDQRVALIIAANDGAELSPQELQNLRLQVLRNLIDETLQIQEARVQEMAVTQDEVDQTYDRLAVQRFNRTPDELNAHLRTIGSSPASLKRQIEGELAWSRLVQRNVEPFVNVSSEEVTELHDRLKAARGTTEYRIGEIYLSATPTTREAVAQNARRILEQIREGGSFPAYARQFSEASTAAVGGELGWIRLEQLQNPALETAAREMQPGQLAGPIEIPGGFSILYVIDQRQIGMADPRDAVLSLKQISLDFPKGTSEAQARQRTAQFTAAVTAMRGCGDADSGAAAIGANVVNNDEIPVRALPEALQQALLQLNVGQTTPPFGSLTEGVRVLMLCGRDDPQVESGPNFDQLMSQLEEDRVGKRAQRYLRDIRRDAVIEYN
jgi:peptidyl-prolyl cis-trans isomerase SurA